MSIRINRKNLLALAVCSAISLGGTAATSIAAPIQWSGTTVTWATGTNWVGGTAPGATDTAVFDGTFTVQPNAGTTSVGGIQIGDPSSTATSALTLAGTQLTIESGGITMYNGAAAATVSSPVTLGATQTWTNGAATLLTMSGVISGNGQNLTINSTSSGGVTLSGANAATTSGYSNLSLNNSGSGAITISSLSINGNGTGVLTQTNTGAGSVTLAGGASQGVQGFTDLSFSNAGTGAGSVSINSISFTGGFFSPGINSLTLSNTNSGTGTFTFSGNIFGAGTGALSVTNTTANKNATTLSSAISGFNAITVDAGTGDVVTFSGGYAATNSATTTLTGGGTLLLTKASVAGSSGGTAVQNGTLKMGIANAAQALGAITLGGANTSGAFDLAGFSQTIGGLDDGASGTGTETVTSSATGALTLTINTSLGSSTFGGVIQNGSATSIAIVKTGLNTQTLTGLNTYTGNTSGTQGTLEFVGQAAGGTESLGGSLTVTSGGLILQSTYAGGTDILKFNNTTFSHTAGATIDFVINGGTPTTNEIQLGTSAVSAFIGPWAFYGTGAATQYATITAGAIVGNYTSGTAAPDATALTPGNSGTNYELAAGGTLTGAATANTVRYSGGGATIATNGNTLTLNGIMNAGTGTLSISNNGTGGVVIGSNKELVVDAANANIEFSNSLAISATSAQTLTIAGPDEVIFDGGITNNNTGGLTIANGSSGVGALVIGSSQTLALNVASGAITVNAPIVDSGSGSSSVTVQGGGANIVTLNGADTFSGGLTLNSGTVALTNAGALGTGVFTINGGTVNGSMTNANANLVVNGSFTFGTGALTLGSFTSGSVTLGADNLTITNNSTSNQNFGAVGDNGNAYSFTKAGTGSITLDGVDTIDGTITVAAGTLTSGSLYATTGGTVINVLAGATWGNNGENSFIAGLNGAGSVTSVGRTFTIVGGGNYNYSGVYTSTNVGFSMAGTGTQTLSGANTAAGGASIYAGTLNLDFSAGTVLSNILYNGISAGLATTVGGGTLELTGSAAGARSQSALALTVASGGSFVDLVNSGTNSLLFSFTTISRSAGGTIDFTLPGNTQSATNGITTTQANDSAGILGGYATVAGADWAVNSSGNIAALSTYTAFTDTVTTNTSNYLLTGSAAATNSQSTGTLKITPSGSGESLAITASKTLTLSNNGLLFTGTNDYTISGGTLAGGSAEVIFQQFAANNNLTVGSVINGAITKSGPGTLTLTAMNTYTGTTTLNDGIVNINSFAAGSASALGAGAANTATATGAAIVFNGGTLQYGFQPTTAAQDITLRQVVINPGGMTIDTNGNNVTFANAFGGPTNNGSRIGAGGLTKTGAGTLTIGGIAEYMGATIIDGGTLSIGSATPFSAATVYGSGASGNLLLTVNSTAGLHVGQTVTDTISSVLISSVIVAIPSATTMYVSAGVGGFGAQGYTAGAPTALNILAFTPVANGGPFTSSSLGMSSEGPENLVIDGGTLQYAGDAGVNASTNRLFTIGSNGGAIDASGTGTLTFSSSGAAVFGSGTPTFTLTGNNTGNNTLNPSISDGAGGVTSLTKSGGGTWVLTANNTYSGLTTITGGTLKLSAANNNIAGSSKIIVGDSLADASAKLDVSGVTNGFVLGGSQTLAGHGTVVGNVTTSSGSILAPGNSIGTTSYSAGLTLAAGTVLNYEFAGSSSSDDSQVAGLLTLPTGTGSITLNMTDAGGLTAGTFKIFGYGTLAGGAPSSLNDTFVINPPGSPSLAGDTYSVVDNMGSNEIDLVISGSPVPEPASLALLGLGAAGLLMRRRRRA